ncbi:MAG: hypothetical protein PT944_03045 [Actinomycetaceae bacterium]|nr:hypothetical protein [Arcanobacterium sp.]MDD7686880.1 hypothetical protein [Actinomycetaceae bacterium]MDY5274029.1 hypothetical protein [Arcanobacterium sp.]
MYKTFTIDYHPRADKLADAVEKKANELAHEGYRVISFSVTNSAKAIILAERD